MKILDGKYVKVKEIGYGTYGKVYQIREVETNKLFSMKKLFIKSNLPENFHEKEINLLNSLNHNNIIKLLERFKYKENHYLIFDYYENILDNLIDKKLLNKDMIKGIFKEICIGIKYLHDNNIIHRDIKGSNILLNKDFKTIKIIDFGGAKKHDINIENSIVVGTRCYKAPEVIYGEKHYDYSFDIWSLGCLFGELFYGKPLFLGGTDIEQLSLIFKTIGIPENNDWKEATKLPFYFSFEDVKSDELYEIIGIPKESTEYNLLIKMLALNPKNRLTIDEILNHDYFK